MSIKLAIAAFLLPLCSLLALFDSTFTRSSLYVLEVVRSICMEAGHLLLAGIGVVDLRLVLAGILPLISLALMAVLSSLTKTRRLSAELLKHQEFPRRQDVTELATRLGIEKETLVVESEQLMAFCYGLLRPRIIVSTELLKRLSNDEVEAVLRHEAWHAHHHDALLAILAVGLRRGLFFLPPVDRVAGRILTAREIRADDAAVHGMGSPYPLASALGKALDWPEQSPKAAASAFSAIDARIDHLLAGPQNRLWKRRRRNLIASALSVAVLGLILCALVTASPLAGGLQSAFCRAC